MTQLENKLEAILFYKNEPLTTKELCKLTGEKEGAVKESLQNLSKNLDSRGICLVMTEEEASLATAPEMKDIIEQIAKDEMSSEVGRAGLETLAIILYNGPISRREIDYIRGVNSTFILRNLCVRGLVQRENDPKDQRVFKYRSSIQLLAHLGLKKTEDLPEFDEFRKNIAEKKEEHAE